MSDDLSAQTSAIFEKLYDERGQPDELDDAFTQEYFKLVKDHVKLDAEEADAGPLVVEMVDVRLSKPNSGFIELDVRDEREKFIVSKLRAVKTLRGSSAKIGQRHGKGTYALANERGFLTITIKTAKSILVFVFPTRVEPHPIKETGEGEWVKA